MTDMLKQPMKPRVMHRQMGFQADITDNDVKVLEWKLESKIEVSMRVRWARCFQNGQAGHEEHAARGPQK